MLHRQAATTSSVAAGWADGETAAVAGPTTYATTDRTLSPNQNLGITMKVTRRALKQSGEALEQAIRRDMNSTIAAELDKAIFLGTGANGQPLGVIPGSSTGGSTGHGIVKTEIDAPADWAAFRSAVVAFMTANAASGPGSVRALIRPELWAWLDGQLIDGTAVSEYDRMTRHVSNIVQTANALAAPAGDPDAVTAVLTTSAGGVAPVTAMEEQALKRRPRYNEARRLARIEAKRNRPPCPECGTPIPPEAPLTRKYCSSRCMNRANNRVRYERERVVKEAMRAKRQKRK